MKKRGFLLAEETLKIVIALIAIGILVYFLASLYYSNKNAKDLELAKASLEHLVDEINAGRTEVDIYNPVTAKTWRLVSWPYIDGTIPKSCSNMGWNNCICLCKNGGNALLDVSFRVKGISGDCDTIVATCLEINKKIIVKGTNVQNPILIKDPPVQLRIDYGNEIEITRAP